MDDLDQRLSDAGTAFRANHDRAVQPRPRRRRLWVLPLAAGLATASVIAGVALALPDRSTPLPPSIATATEATLDLPEVDGLAVNADWVALTGGPLSAADNRLQVRRRSDLHVTDTITTRFAHGQTGCPHLDGDELLWTDNEVIPSDLIPGPIGRWSLWKRDLRTGQQVQLDSGRGETLAGYGFSPCALGSDGVVAWQPDEQHLTVFTLSTGSRYTTLTKGQLLGLVHGEPVVAETITYCIDCPSGVFPQGFAITVGGREVARISGAVSAAADDSHLIVFAQKAGSDTRDGELISVCSLPACRDLMRVADDPASGNAVLGSTFVAWSSLRGTPILHRFDGGKQPRLAPGEVSFRAVAAFGDILGYVSRPGFDQLGDAAPTVLHLQRIPSSV